MDTAIHKIVHALQADEYPLKLARMISGWAVIGETQILPGYCLLLPDPVVPHLNSLQSPQRLQFLADFAALGDAVLKATGALRINYEILGNLEPALHGHVFPRYSWENEALRTKPIWFYDWQAADKFSAEKHDDVFQRIRKNLLG
jgi:diadenosine tetraphosphate (Ap4A) HIT family hydrolase